MKVETIPLIALLCVTCSFATFAEDLTVKGNVHATWSSLTRVSPAQDAIVHAGDTVTVTLSGQIDVNQSVRHESHCDLFVFCHDVSIPIHNFRTPGQAPVNFEIRPVGGGPAVASATIGASPGILQVPISDAAFETHYEIVALLAGAGTSIAPERSAGSFMVGLDIDAGGRASYFGTWLEHIRPNAARATATPAIADDLRTKGSVVARALREYAISAYPVPNMANNESHVHLVRAAVSLAPGDVENSLALARYFRAVGLDRSADTELANAITKLENRNDPRSRRQLGDAYMARMEAVLKKSGAIDPAATQAALAFADHAVRAYGQANRKDLVSKAQFVRGRLLRGMRTRVSLNAAIEAFRSALVGAPEIVSADTVLQNVDGSRIYAMKFNNEFSLGSIVDGPNATDPDLMDRVPIAWDSARRRLLAAGKGGLSWLSPKLDAPDAAPAVSPGGIQVGNGAIARQTDLSRVDYFSNDNIATSVPVGGANKTTCQALPPFKGGGIRGMSLSLDGSVLVVLCNSTVRVFVYGGGNLRELLEKKLAPVPIAAHAVAGPATCGTVVITYPHAGQPTIKYTLLRPGHEITLLDFPAPSRLALSINPPPGPGRITFANDRVLIASSTRAISTFRCSDGHHDGDITLPLVPDPVMPDAGFGLANRLLTPPPGMWFQWLTGSKLAIVRTWARSVDVIEWPNQSVTHFKTSPTISDIDIFQSAHLLLPPAVVHGAPLMFKPHRKMELVEYPATAHQPVLEFDIPGGRAPIYLTPDGSHLIVQRPGTPTWIAENKVGATLSKGSSDEVTLDIVGNHTNRVVGKLNAQGHLMELHVAGVSAVAIPLPQPSPSYFAKAVPALQQWYNVWKKIPNPPRPPGMFQNKDLPGVIADPKRLTTVLNVLTSRYFLESFMALQPLSSSQGRSYVLLCARLAAKPAGGGTPIPISGPLPDVPFLGTETGGTLRLREAPALPITAPTLPTGIPLAPPSCQIQHLVRGLSPTLVNLIGGPGGPRLQMLTASGWIRTNVVMLPMAGWSLSDGDLLLLLPDRRPGKFTLVRVNGKGQSSPACARCSSLALGEAFRQFAPPKIKPPAQLPFIGGGPISMVMIDATGRFLARPDGDETIVISLADESVVARAPLGKPLVVTQHLLALSSGDRRVRYYRY